MASKDRVIRRLTQRMRACSDENSWFTVLAPWNESRQRMPFCDRVSPAPLKKPEQRPLKPVGVFRFNYKEGEVESVEAIRDKDGLEGLDWLKLGCVRRDA